MFLQHTGCFERKCLIGKLRKDGNFIYNTDENYKTGEVISTRRTNKSTTVHLIPCGECKGFYSSCSLRVHYRKCSTKGRAGQKNVFIESRRIHGNIHKKACTILRTDVFPVLRSDNVIDTIRYDELVILYGNIMCCKYRSPHHFDMIRARLRLIGRFLLAIKELNPAITDFASVYVPNNYDNIVKAINVVANLDEKKNTYSSPTTAFSLGTALKFNANTLIVECIKNGDKEKKKLVADVLKLLERDLASSINKTVTENLLEKKRHRKVVLPLSDDIIKLNNFLTTNRRLYYRKVIDNEFSFENWKQLASFTLISIQVFNRRRSGELERALISDFNCYQSVDEETNRDIFNSLSSAAKRTAKRYVRFVIRGKLARGVPVLLHNELVNIIKIIIKFRESAGVSNENPYIFGMPSKSAKCNYLRATKLLREYSVQCGAANPTSLRGTELRKHIASQSVLLNLRENEVSDLAKFLGHSDKIHKDHYQMPIIARDVAQISRLLEMAQSRGEEHSDSDDMVNECSKNTLDNENYMQKNKETGHRLNTNTVCNEPDFQEDDLNRRSNDDLNRDELQPDSKFEGTISQHRGKRKCNMTIIKVTLCVTAFKIFLYYI